MVLLLTPSFFFFNDTATTEIYTLSLHDALPISVASAHRSAAPPGAGRACPHPGGDRGARRRRGPAGDGIAYRERADRKSTRLNSSHANISYAVFCLKKKKTSLGRLRVPTRRPRY